MVFTQSIATDLQQWCRCRYYLWTLNNHSHLQTGESDNKEEWPAGGGQGAIFFTFHPFKTTIKFSSVNHFDLDL